MQAPTLSPPRHPLEDGLAPTWASAWGEDRFNAWVAFEVEGVEQRMRWIPPGRFPMGSPEDEKGRFPDEGPRHEVTLTEGFWLGETAVTQKLWRAVTGENPSRFHEDPTRPVENVSWDLCQTFLAELEEKLPGLKPRIPTEAEWEYACRAGTDTPFHFGKEISQELANFDSRRTVPVGTYPPNPWGLREMHGNVWEWCADGRRDYDETPQLNPRGPEGARRVFRGGSWLYDARHVRSAYRAWSVPGVRVDDLGLRLARGQGESAEPG